MLKTIKPNYEFHGNMVTIKPPPPLSKALGNAHLHGGLSAAFEPSNPYQMRHRYPVEETGSNGLQLKRLVNGNAVKLIPLTRRSRRRTTVGDDSLRTAEQKSGVIMDSMSFNNFTGQSPESAQLYGLAVVESKEKYTYQEVNHARGSNPDAGVRNAGLGRFVYEDNALEAARIEEQTRRDLLDDPYKDLTNEAV